MKYTDKELELRDKFAMAALTGLLSGGTNVHEDLITPAYTIANQMMHQRLNGVENTTKEPLPNSKQYFNELIKGCFIEDVETCTFECAIFTPTSTGACKHLTLGYCKLGHKKGYKQIRK